MLSGFQEAAQKVQGKDENALVPFAAFYDTVHTFLESPIRRVIDRCQTAADKHDGVEQRDVGVLKLLLPSKYIRHKFKQRPSRKSFAVVFLSSATARAFKML